MRARDFCALGLVASLATVASGLRPQWMTRAVTEPLLQDAQCNMEKVEEANSAQLNALLTEVTETAFFRLISVNMDGKCQYWGGPDAEEPSCGSGGDGAHAPASEFAATLAPAEPAAPPLCSLGADPPAPPFGVTDPFGTSSSFGVSAAPPPSDPVDATITPEEGHIISGIHDPDDCTNEELPSFWLDLCSAIPTNASDYVNLQRNPESYTGYNGTKVWDAIYQENCLQRTAGHEEGICLEERVLYRCVVLPRRAVGAAQLCRGCCPAVPWVHPGT